MKTLTTLEHPAVAATSQTLLSKHGFACVLTTLQPSEGATAIDAAQGGEEHLLFVVDGEVSVRTGEITTLLKKEEAFLLPKEQTCSVSAFGQRPAKVLRVDVPPRQVVEPPIYAFESAK